MEMIYKKAIQYLDTNLWKQLWDNQLFAVKFSDGEIGYCCVMGAAGEHLALGIYVGEVGIQTYLRMASNFEGCTDIDDIEIKTSQECIMCSFCKSSELNRREQLKLRSMLMKLGYKPNQLKRLPSFEKYTQYHLPTTNISKTEQQYFIEAFDACFEVTEKLKTKSLEELHLINDRELLGKTIPYLVLRKDGKYTWRTKKLPEDIFYPFYEAQKYNELLAKKVKNMKYTDQTWLCGTFRLANPVKDENGIPMFPLVQVLVDEESEMIYNMRVCDSNIPYCITLPNQLFDIILQFGKPRKMILCDIRVIILYEPLLKDLGIEFEYKPHLKTINRIKLQLRNFR